MCETIAKKGFTDSWFDGILHLPLLKSIKQVGGIQLFSSTEWFIDKKEKSSRLRSPNRVQGEYWNRCEGPAKKIFGIF
jgi:hypothetical protein